MRPRSGRGLRRRSRFSFPTRHVERVIPLSLVCQHHCHRLQPLERESFRLTQIGPVQLALPRAIGAPVCSPAPVACMLFVCGEATMLTAKGEDRGCLEPSIPVGGVHHDLYGKPIPQVGEDAILDDRRDLNHRCLPCLPSAPEQGFPNSIAHVRESLPEAFGTRTAARFCSTRTVSRASAERKRAAKAFFHLFIPM